MTAGELKDVLNQIPDDREVRVRISGDEKNYPIFDLGYDGALGVELIYAEEK